jgi:hypothetical protein
LLFSAYSRFNEVFGLKLIVLYQITIKFLKLFTFEA